jgi:hypothetical protein
MNLDRRWSAASPIEHLDKMLIFGGWDIEGPLNDTLIYDFQKSRWDVVKNSSKSVNNQNPSPRRWHSFTSVDVQSNNHFILFGGYNAQQLPLGDMYMFDLGILKLQTTSTLTMKKVLQSG